ncbi:MAG: hypothetical protein GC203_10480 [Phenylobacterium sp.]|uniref:hypothetical protein n=1 Tax=Phenylobacterium sp. TaxID=1871053 RepID=UPI0025CF28B6|nr:hypothetical protein [Phenylobacterium sp.]MBI1198277.1 hypothetical protein [Phenylobacterium sp.]
MTGAAGLARWAYWAVLLAGLALMLRLNLPGHLSVDSVLALREGRLHVRDTWNPAIYSWLLGVFDGLRPGTALAVVASGLLLFGAWAAMAFLRPRTSWLAPILAVGAIALPQVAIYPGIVWKDVWFAESAIAGFVVLALSLGSAVPAARWAGLALAALLLAAAGLLRQNGLILAPAAALAIAWAAWPRGGRRALALAAVWLAAVAALTLALSVAAKPQGMGPPDPAGAKGLRILETYDVVGAAAHGGLPLARIDRVSPELDDQIRAAAPADYSPERVDTLGGDPRLDRALGKVPGEVMRAEWLDLVLHHPETYLAVRAEVFRWVFATPVIDRCLPVHVGIAGPPAALADLKMQPRRSRDDIRLYNYVTWFLDTPAYSHVAYAAVALAVGLVLLWRREPADLAMAGLMAGALGFTASFFVISIACDYRYLYFLDMAAVTGVIYLALDPRLSRPKARRRAGR